MEKPNGYISVVNYTAAELQKLKQSKYNRAINDKQVEKLLKLMHINGYDQGEMIIINKKTNEIADGQHRAMAFIRYAEETNQLDLEIPVLYRVWETEEDMAKWIRDKNNSQANWTPADWIHIWRQSNPSYDRCDELAKINPALFCELDKDGNIKKHPRTGAKKIRYSYILATMYGTPGRTYHKNNSLNVTSADEIRFYTVYKELNSIAKAVGWSLTQTDIGRYDMFAVAYVRYKERYNVGIDIILQTIKGSRKLRNRLNMKSGSTAQHYADWFDMINKQLHGDLK